MKTKKCIGCSQSKAIAQFNFKDKAGSRRNARCKLCSRKQVMKSYYRRRRYYVRQAAIRNRRHYKAVTQFIYNYLLSHPCVDCGVNDPRVLQFDHVRGRKDREVSNMLRARLSLQRIDEEIKKCEVRCANCHSVKTAQERNYYKGVEIVENM